MIIKIIERHTFNLIPEYEVVYVNTKHIKTLTSFKDSERNEIVHKIHMTGGRDTIHTTEPIEDLVNRINKGWVEPYKNFSDKMSGVL